MAKQFTGGKKERVKSRKLTEQLFASGKKMIVPPFRIHYLLWDDPVTLPAPLQFSVGVPSRNFKKAVDRNRIKRLTREAWRLQKQELEECLKTNSKQSAVFFIYTAKELPAFDEVKSKTGVALKKLVKLLRESPSSNT